MQVTNVGWEPLWDWTRMTERDRAAAWCELTEWVDHTLIGRHDLGGCLAPDWRQDEELVRTLIRFHEWEAEAGDGAEHDLWLSTLHRAASDWRPQAA